MPQGADLIRHRLFRLSVLGGGWVPQVAPELKVPASAGEVTDAGLIPGWEIPLEEEMATHSRIQAWRIPWTVEPGRLQSIGSQRVGHD